MLLALPAAASHKPASALDIRVVPGGWGEVAPETIGIVLHAVAAELVPVLPAKLSVPIIVSHTRGNPVALYQRGSGGEYQVRLHASGASWSLYVYEFAHELCHVLSNHDEHAVAGVRRHNQWLEETLCETASLYALAAVAATWELAPPEPVWAAHAPRLRRFYDRLLAEESRRLPAGTTLTAWLAEHEPSLRANPYLRQKNDLVAAALLPFFREDPRRWRALGYLNLHGMDPVAELPEYLAHWNEKAPVEYRGFIGQVRTLLARPAPAAPSMTVTAATVMPYASAGPLRLRPPTETRASNATLRMTPEP